MSNVQKMTKECGKNVYYKLSQIFLKKNGPHARYYNMMSVPLNCSKNCGNAALCLLPNLMKQMLNKEV